MRSSLSRAPRSRLVAACATNPVTGRREFSLMSEAQEIAVGRESDPQIKAEMGVYDDPDLQQYVERHRAAAGEASPSGRTCRGSSPSSISRRSTPSRCPGGFIYITRGILPFLDNEAELAGVLGHEIGHVTARHSAQQYTRTVGGGRPRRPRRLRAGGAPVRADLGSRRSACCS